MNKAYPNKVNWQNTPSTSTPLGATNLNKMSDALDTIDDRVITLDSDKVDKDGDKVLSDNNYTDEDKTKLGGISSGATATSISNVLADGDTIATITIDGTATNIKAEQVDISEYAGESPELISGGSMALVTPEFEENAPYVYRQSCGGKSNLAPIMKEQLIGGSVVWNQLIENGNFATNSGWSGNRGTVSIANNKCTFTVTESIGANALYKGKATELNHIYLCTMSVTPSKKTKCAFFVGGSGGGDFTANANTKTTYSAILKATNASTFMLFYCNRDLDLAVGDTVDYENINVTDLTAEFSSNIADYVYSLETAQSGSGIAWLKKYNLIDDKFHAYSANTIQSVKVASKKVVGFNQCDEEFELGDISADNGQNIASTTVIRTKNYIQIFPETNYFIRISSSLNVGFRTRFYDKNKNFIGIYDYSGSTIKYNTSFKTPSNAYYLRFTPQTSYGTTYNHDICVNLHWDGSRDGEYEPYSKHTTDLSGSHTVNRKYALVDLGSLNYVALTLSNNRVAYYTSLTNLPTMPNYSSGRVPNAICEKFLPTYQNASSWSIGEFVFTVSGATLPALSLGFITKDTDYTDATAFKTAMSGVYLVYEKATPTTETVTNPTLYGIPKLDSNNNLYYDGDTVSDIPNPQIVVSGGTEEFVDAEVQAGNRDVSIPVGGNRKYRQAVSVPSLPTSGGKVELTYDPTNGVFSWE